MGRLYIFDNNSWQQWPSILVIVVAMQTTFLQNHSYGGGGEGGDGTQVKQCTCKYRREGGGDNVCPNF